MITVRRVAGVLVILFGVSVLFDFNMPGAINPFNWWPMLLILPGLVFVLGGLSLCFLMFGLFSSLRGYLGPILLIGLGLFLLIPKHRKK